MTKPNIAVVYLPGNNCEEETLRAVRLAGMDGKIVRWNQRETIQRYDGYVIGGGWAYEDRIRAGVIASKDPIIKLVKEQALSGKPVLGICNGAQVLVETGMVPGLKDEVEMALAPNMNPFVEGYYCTWVYVRSEQEDGRSCVTAGMPKDVVVPMPIAHGEGRFMTSDPDVLKKMEKDRQIIFRYCTHDGEIKDEFPVNPNGSVENIAGICNKEGNVAAMMPHPERGAQIGNMPHQGGKLAAAGDIRAMQEGSPSLSVIASLKEYLERNT